MLASAETMENKAVAIALQLGTSCYRVGCLDNGTVIQLPNQFGNDETAAYFATTGTEILYGNDAKNYAAIDADVVVCDPMKTFYDEIDPKVWPKQFTPQTVLRHTIRALLRDTVSNWREDTEIKAVVVSVSEGYLHHGKAEIKAIIHQALPEIDAVLIIPKTTAAFLGYALSRDQCGDGNYLVLAVGSYLTELNIFHVEKQTAVCLKSADTLRFGGQDFDDVLVEHCWRHFYDQTGVDIRENRSTMYRLRAHCEMAKRKLSTASVTIVEIPQLLPGKTLKVQVTRKELEEKMAELVHGFVNWLIKQIESHNMPISAVLITGGACRIPVIQSSIKSLFNSEQVKAACNAIAHCAAIMGTTALTAAFSNWDLFEKLVNANLEAYNITDIRHAMAESASLLDVRQSVEEINSTKDSSRMESSPRRAALQSDDDQTVDKTTSYKTKKVISVNEQIHTTITMQTFEKDKNAPDTKRPRLALNFEVPSFQCRATVTEYVRCSKSGLLAAIRRRLNTLSSAFLGREKEDYKQRHQYRANLYFSNTTSNKLALEISPEGQEVRLVTLLVLNTEEIQSGGENTLTLQLKRKDPRTDRSLDSSSALRFDFQFQSFRDCDHMRTIIRDHNRFT